MRSLYPSIAKNFLLPLADKLVGTNIYKNLKYLEKSQFWSKEELERYQLKKLQYLIKHSYQSVPFYHRYLRNKKKYPADIKSLKDLQIFPIIDKDFIYRNKESFISKKFRGNLIRKNTGGTTGRPFVYYNSPSGFSTSVAAKIRGYEWTGVDYGSRRASLGGSSLFPNAKIPLKKKIQLLLEQNLPLPAISNDVSTHSDYLIKMRKFRPQLIRGYPSSIYNFCDNLEKDSLQSLNIRAVITTAEVLQPQWRNLIENSFGCRVFDEYGAGDGGGRATECNQHTGLHAHTDQSILEVVEMETDRTIDYDSSGSLVWTDLNNYAMPFIRYSPGDIGSVKRERCSCGRCLPLLNSIEGRTTDIIKFGNGRTLGGPALTLIFREFRIKQYQIVQKKINELQVNIVKEEKYTDSEHHFLLKTMKQHCGDEVEIDIQYLDSITNDDKSKYRFIISEI